MARYLCKYKNTLEDRQNGASLFFISNNSTPPTSTSTWDDDDTIMLIPFSLDSSYDCHYSVATTPPLSSMPREQTATIRANHIPSLPWRCRCYQPLPHHRYFVIILYFNYLISQRQHTTNNNAMAAPMPFSANNSTSTFHNQT